MTEEILTSEKEGGISERFRESITGLPSLLKRTGFGLLGFGIMLGVGKGIEQIPYIDKYVAAASKFLVGIDTTGEIPNFLGMYGFVDVFKRFGRREYLYKDGKLYRGDLK